jgi:small subunit ribosomal protein S4
MGRDRGPRNKLSRREGRDLFGGGPGLQRRLEQPPGVHGPAARFRRQRQSDYGRQLREKQAVKRMYGMRERQFRRFLQMAQRSREPTGPALLKLLERRLDNVVYRLGFARTRPQARQMVNHGHVLVDGRRVDIASYLVEPGQVVAVREIVRGIPGARELLEAAPPVPPWLDRHNGRGQVVREPRREEIDPDINEQLIIEFYSR